MGMQRSIIINNWAIIILNLAVGANIRNYINDFKSTTAVGFSNDRFTNIAFANSYALNSAPKGDYNLERLFGSFASLNYSYRNKYMADLSARSGWLFQIRK